MSKDKLQWITISSEQAILMSVSLQSLVDELVMKKNGLKRRKNSFKGRWSYMKRDGSVHLFSIDDISSNNKVSVYMQIFQMTIKVNLWRSNVTYF